MPTRATSTERRTEKLDVRVSRATLFRCGLNSGRTATLEKRVTDRKQALGRCLKQAAVQTSDEE
jgi:hypothetical protein